MRRARQGGEEEGEEKSRVGSGRREDDWGGRRR